MGMRFRTKMILFLLITAGFVHHTSAQSCSPPLIFTSSEISDTSVILRWFTLNEPDSGYQIDVQLQGIPPSSSPTFLTSNADRDTISGLSPQTAYTAYIRSVCTSDTSEWKQIDFFTALRNGTSCGINFELRDNSCQNGAQQIPVFVKNYKGDRLGNDVKLTDIELIIAHSYPADLKLKLINPAGKEILLTQYHGTQSDHFGDPSDSLCMQTTIFSADACSSIYDQNPPFIGAYQSDESLEILNDGSFAYGKWILEICDRAPDDIGNLNYVKLNFSQNTCPQPPSLSPTALSDTLQRMSYMPVDADSMIVLYSSDSLSPDSLQDPAFQKSYAIPSDSLVELNGLEVREDYYFWTYLYCNGQWIGPSCQSKFSTVPGHITHYSNWESEGICTQDCDTSCTIDDGFWNSLGASWQSTKGNTPSPATGPERDVFYDGIYLYKESSTEHCRDESSILQSICLSKTNSNFTGITFYAHLSGSGVGKMLLRVSNDQWTTSDTLWVAEGHQGADWLRSAIEFPDSLASPFQLQFIAAGSQNAFGDIALGDVALIGVEAVSRIDQLAFPDEDLDNYGNGNIAIFYCGAELPDTLSLSGDDCNDQDPAIHPLATDTVCNGKDENCDGHDNLGGASELTISIDSIQSPNCPQSHNGFIGIRINGGLPPYDILWSTGDTSNTLDSVQNGVYSVQVSDDQQCQTTSKSVTLESAKAVQFAFQILQQPSCPTPSNGSVTVSLSGGTPPFQYEWSNGESGDTASALPAGMFYLEVEDSEGCIYQSDTTMLNARQAYDVEIIAIKELSCPGSKDASLRALAPDATPPLQFQWNTGDTTALIDQLSAGAYTVSITDDQNCTIISDSVVVLPPDSIELTQLSIDPQRCAGFADGHLMVKAQGGTPPYSFRWLSPRGNVLNGAELNQILPGYYNLTVTDRKGCSLNMDSILVPAQPPIVLDLLNIKDTKCPLSKDGKIEIEIGGGAAPYEFVWSDGERLLKERHQLSAGTYGLTVSDALDCKQTFNNLQIEKGDSSLHTVLNVVDSLFCGENDEALIEAMVVKGESPYRFNWSAGVEHRTGNSVDTLAISNGGNYQVTVTDGIGCVGISNEIHIDSFANITIDSLHLRHPQCFSDGNGRIEIEASSNQPPVAYKWSNQEDSAIIDSLFAGIYELTISDQSNCQPKQFKFLLEQPDSLNVFIDSTQRNDSICFQLDSIAGGSPPYKFYWWKNEKKISTNEICIHQSEKQSIYIELTDARNCNRKELIYESVSSLENKLLSNITIFPNPFEDNLYIDNQTGSQLQATIINSTGSILGEFTVNRGRNEIYMKGVPAGTYFLKMSAATGHSSSFKITAY